MKGGMNQKRREGGREGREGGVPRGNMLLSPESRLRKRRWY